MPGRLAPSVDQYKHLGTFMSTFTRSVAERKHRCSSAMAVFRILVPTFSTNLSSRSNKNDALPRRQGSLAFFRDGHLDRAPDHDCKAPQNIHAHYSTHWSQLLGRQTSQNLLRPGREKGWSVESVLLQARLAYAAKWPHVTACRSE